MKIKLKEIDLSKIYDSCRHPDLHGDLWYLVKYGENWIVGKFGEQWYGWSFRWFWSVTTGLQLDALDEVYQINFKE